MGNDNWKALMAEEEVGCEDFEPINLCDSCQKKCKEGLPEVRILTCQRYEQTQIQEKNNA
jgi:hypothetical protein